MMKENNTTSKRTWIVPPGLIASVKSFENLYKLRQAIPLMIIGPSGVGKSLFVHIYEHLYKCEHGDAKPFKRLNCSTFSKELITSELFGHAYRTAFDLPNLQEYMEKASMDKEQDKS